MHDSPIFHVIRASPRNLRIYIDERNLRLKRLRPMPVRIRFADISRLIRCADLHLYEDVTVRRCYGFVGISRRVSISNFGRFVIDRLYRIFLWECIMLGLCRKYVWNPLLS